MALLWRAVLPGTAGGVWLKRGLLGSKKRCPPRRPTGTEGNAIAERFVGSLRRELLDRILIVNQPHAVAALAEYERHVNEHRPHRALRHAAPLWPLPDPHPRQDFRVCRRDRLGGLLHEYTQVA